MDCYLEFAAIHTFVYRTYSESIARLSQCAVPAVNVRRVLLDKNIARACHLSYTLLNFGEIA